MWQCQVQQAITLMLKVQLARAMGTAQPQCSQGWRHIPSSPGMSYLWAQHWEWAREVDHFSLTAAPPQQLQSLQGGRSTTLSTLYIQFGTVVHKCALFEPVDNTRLHSFPWQHIPKVCLPWETIAFTCHTFISCLFQWVPARSAQWWLFSNL